MAKTLPDLFLEAVQKYKKPDQFLRRREGVWEPVSAEEALLEIEEIALGLRTLGVAKGDRVIILSENRYEWAITDLAVLGLGAVTVPIYPTLTPDQCLFIIQDAQAKIAVVSNDAQLKKVHEVARRFPLLNTFVYMDSVGAAHPSDRAFSSVRQWGASQRQKSPNAYRNSVEEIDPNDAATIIYTSGTTGEPKGAMLSHSNIVFNVESAFSQVSLKKNDRCLSFLPLSHVFERMAGLYGMIYGGVSIAYAQNISRVSEYVLEVRPTVMTGVPRFYEKIYARVMETAQSRPYPMRKLFEWGLEQGRKRARAHFAGKSLSGTDLISATIADRLVGAKVRARMGGRLRLCISGGAPLSPDVLEFFFAIGIPILEGYGLTETSPVITLNRQGKERPGSVGQLIPGVEVRIADNGEILTRGPHVMLGYFENEEATREAIKDGWFHTGDIGHFDDEGYLFITDRLKQLLINAGGKKVAPQPIEANLKSSKWVAEAVLMGDRMPYFVALIVPDFAQIEIAAKNHGWGYASRAELVARPEVLELFQEVVDGTNNGLARFEQIKRFALLEEELLEERGELTPTLKVRRKVIQEHFVGKLEQLYEGHPLPEMNPTPPPPAIAES